MPESGFADESAKSDRKFFGKHRWRGKLFPNEEKTTRDNEAQGQQVNDIAEFLQNPADRKGSIQWTAPPTFHKAISPPSRLLPAFVNANPTPQPITYLTRKSSERKGLHVSFDTAEPEVIGEGGDEAILPSIDVRKSRPPASQWQEPTGSNVICHQRRASPPIEDAPNLRWSLRQGLRNETIEDDDEDDDDESLSSPPLRQQSTGVHGLEPNDGRRLSNQNLKREDNLATESLNEGNTLRSPGSNGTSASFAATYASYTRDRPLSPGTFVERSAPQPEQGRSTHKDDIEDLKGFASLQPFSPGLDAPIGNSLTPIPSPQPITTQAALSSSYNFPSSVAGQRSPSQVDVVTRRYQESTAYEIDKDAGTSIPTPIPPLKSSPISLGNVARGLGEDAFQAFLARIRRFYGIFRLAAVVNRSFESITLVQWIRASTWWFLKGRGELESAVRGRRPSSDRVPVLNEGNLSAGLKQAYLDLAKACWILTEIVPTHEEIKKYGNASMSSLSPIMRNFGDKKLAEMLDMYHVTMTNMRALTMSMKRNTKLPPDDFELQSLDSRIWVELPRFASGVAGILAGGSSMALLEDGSAGSTAFPFPIGDTPRQFNYGSMFVSIILRSSVESHEGVHLSCILSILRQKTGRELEVVLASQDGQLNLRIQSDRRAGPTWRDAHWKTNDSSINIGLNDGLDLKIRLSEPNFRSLWGIYDYTRKVRKEMESGEGEELVFESVVQCVHCVDSPDAKVFPPDPIRSCDVLLFEKTLTFTEGTGRRRFYNGHRLVAVTPPNSKTLSSIDQNLGKQTPILFTYVRGEDDGAALLMKNETAGSTLVITFNDTLSRNHFQTLLDGTFLQTDESCTEPVALRAIAVATMEDGSSVTQNTSLGDWRWQQLRVINRSAEFSENIIPKTTLSENLRIWVQCDSGTFVDRVNLGTVFLVGLNPEYLRITGQGELQIRLSIDNLTEITLLRPPQQDMTVSFAGNLVSTSKARMLNEAIYSISKSPSTRTYIFSNLRGQVIRYFQTSSILSLTAPQICMLFKPQ